MPHPLRQITAAADFAARRHAGQTLKGKQRRPYINHLAEVAALVAALPAGDDPEIIAAAYLHDVVEDEHASADEIEARFGGRVRRLVEELTDDMSLPEKERKRRQVEEVEEKSREARLLKLADKISKVREMADDPPSRWSTRKIRHYVEWCVAVVDAGCRGLDASLEREFERAVAAALRTEPGHV